MSSPSSATAPSTAVSSSSAPQTLTQAIDAMPKAIHNLEFPPFPHIQKNVEIIPFADFKPKGIHIKDDNSHDDDDEVDVSPELDGEGVPTIMLRVTHDLEKTGKKNKKNKSAGSKTRDDGTPKPWFEQWEDSEILMRAERLDPARFSPHDCLVQADIDFQHRRNFPIPVRSLYDELRVFLGVIERIPKRKPFYPRQPEQQPLANESTTSANPTAAAQEDQADAAAEDAISDDEADDEDDNNVDEEDSHTDAATAAAASASAPAAAAASIGDDQYTGSLEPIVERSDYAAPARFEQFLANPPLAIKCFLSAEFVNRGLYWAEWNLHALPIITSAFLEFLLRHELLPSEYTQGLRAAAAVARAARHELPKTKKAATVLRDGWGSVCADIWGPRNPPRAADYFASWPVDEDDEGYITEVGDAVPPVTTVVMEDQLDLSDPQAAASSMAAKPSVDSLRTAVEASSSFGGTTAIRDDATTSDTHNGWGDSASDTASIVADEKEQQQNDVSNIFEQDLSATDRSASGMFHYVGCASFPLTHAVVRAERSVREILAVNPPMAPLPPQEEGKPAKKLAHPPSLLHTKLATVVLGPWRGKTEEDGTIPPPAMLPIADSIPTSSLVKLPVDDATTAAPATTEELDPTAAHTAQFFKTGEHGEVHDAHKDLITVFVDPAIVSELTVGLGVAGIFVQAARRLDAVTWPAIKDGNDAATTPAREGGKSGKSRGAKGKDSQHPHDGRSWWYIDSVSQIVPSFWTETSELPPMENFV